MNFTELISYDDLPFDYEEINITDENQLTVKDITISNALNGKIEAYIVIPEGIAPFPAVHFIH